MTHRRLWLTGHTYSALRTLRSHGCLQSGHVTIDHLSGTPVYLQLAAILRAAIKSGELEPDRPLPSYMTLMQEHGVARGTAAKAVRVLVDEGLVRIVPGRGAYVIEQ
jgi:GntR family transcriptional regulator